MPNEITLDIIRDRQLTLEEIAVIFGTDPNKYQAHYLKDIDGWKENSDNLFKSRELTTQSELQKIEGDKDAKEDNFRSKLEKALTQHYELSNLDTTGRMKELVDLLEELYKDKELASRLKEQLPRYLELIEDLIILYIARHDVDTYYSDVLKIQRNLFASHLKELMQLAKPLTEKPFSQLTTEITILIEKIMDLNEDQMSAEIDQYAAKFIEVEDVPTNELPKQGPKESEPQA